MKGISDMIMEIMERCPWITARMARYEAETGIPVEDMD